MSYPDRNYPTYTAATRPTAANVPVSTIINISDYGINGSLWRSNGSVWVPVSHAIRQQELTTGVILPSLVAANAATYSQVGTTITVDNTVGHGIPATTFNGNSVYLTPSSGTLVEGIFTNFQRTGANTFTCVSTISETISGNLESTTGIKTLATFTLPAGIMGATGRFETMVDQQFLGSVNTKTVTYTFDGITYYTLANTSAVSMANITGVRNKNATNVQQATCESSSTGISTTTANLLKAAVDTTANVTVALRGTVAAANEYICIEHASLLVYPSTIS